MPPKKFPLVQQFFNRSNVLLPDMLPEDYGTIYDLFDERERRAFIELIELSIPSNIRREINQQRDTYEGFAREYFNHKLDIYVNYIRNNEFRARQSDRLAARRGEETVLERAQLAKKKKDLKLEKRPGQQVTREELVAQNRQIRQEQQQQQQDIDRQARVARLQLQNLLGRSFKFVSQTLFTAQPDIKAMFKPELPEVDELFFNPQQTLAPTFNRTDIDTCSLICSYTDQDGNIVNHNAEETIQEFQVIIRDFQQSIYIADSRDIDIEANLLRPFFTRIRYLFRPIIERKFAALDQKTPSPLHKKLLKGTPRDDNQRYPPEKFLIHNNFLDSMIQIFTQEYPEFFHLELLHMFPEEGQETVLRILAQILAVEERMVNPIYNTLDTAAIRDVASEIWTFLTEWTNIYWENNNYTRYLDQTGVYHLANIIAQNYWGDEMDRIPVPPHRQLSDYDNWYEHYTDQDPSRSLWTYLVINFYIRAMDLDPLDLRLVKILFHPHDVRIVQIGIDQNPIPDTEIPNFMPFISAPFLIPHLILNNWVGDTEINPMLMNLYSPGLMISKLLNQPRGVQSNVSTYSIRHRDHYMYAFNVSVVPADGFDINSQPRARLSDNFEVRFLYQTARSVSSILSSYAGVIRNAFLTERNPNNQYIIARLRETVFSGQPHITNREILQWLNTHDQEYPDVQPSVRIIMNFYCHYQSIAEDLEKNVREIPIEFKMGPNYYNSIQNIITLEPDDPVRIEFFVLRIQDKINDYLTEVNEKQNRVNTWETVSSVFTIVGQQVAYSLTGLSLQINHLQIPDPRNDPRSKKQIDSERKFTYFNALSAARYERIEGNQDGVSTNIISRGVFNQKVLPFHLREIVNDQIPIYTNTLTQGYSCLAAVISTVFEAIGYKYKPIDFDGTEYLDLLDNITMYGFQYVEEYIFPMLSLIEGDSPEVYLILGDKDILYHHMVKQRQYFEVTTKRFVGLAESVLRPISYQQFKIPCWNRDNPTFRSIAFCNYDLLQTYNPDTDPTIMRGYHSIVVPLFMKHLFFVKDWSQYINCLADWSRKKDRPIRNIDAVPFPQLPGKIFPSIQIQTQEFMIFYDLETTCGVGIVMQPYLVTYSIIKAPFNLDFNPEDVHTLYIEGQDCISKFIQTVKNTVQRLPDKSHVHLHAFNGSRFDHIFLLPYIYRQWSDIHLTGSPSNVKQCTIYCERGIKVVLEDTQAATGSRSLDSFVKSMGFKEAKLDCEEILLIESIDYWNHCSQTMKNKIIQYGIRDTQIAVAAFLKFNKTMHLTSIKLYKQLRPRGKSPSPNTIRDHIFTKPTLASTAYQIVHKIVRQSTIQILDDPKTYQAIRASYYGGITQVFSKEHIYIDDLLTQCIEYIDINSLYPSVMANEDYAGVFGKVEPYQGNLTSNSIISSHHIYGVSSFKLNKHIFQYGFIPVRTLNTKRIFYPISWNRSIEGRISGIEYKDDNIEQLIWVWGFQLKKIFEIEHIYNSTYSTFVVRQIIRNQDTPSRMFSDIRKIYNMRREEQDENLKQMYKLIMNSSYGKYGQRDFPVDHYVCLDQLQAHVKNGSLQEYMEYVENTQYAGGRLIITEIQEHPEINIARVTCKIIRREPSLPINPKPRSVHIASQITAHSRNSIMYRMYVAKFQAPQIRMMYMDTDSVIFAGDVRSTAQALASFGCGDELGQFKREYTNIIQFQALAPKMYRIKLATNETLLKLKGASQKYIDQEQMNKIFDDIVIGERPSYTQIQWKRHVGTCRITQTPIKKTISIFDKRWYGRFAHYNQEEDSPYLDETQALVAEELFEKDQTAELREQIERYRQEQIQDRNRAQLDEEIDRLRAMEEELD